jgi:hypothetical protein
MSLSQRLGPMVLAALLLSACTAEVKPLNSLGGDEPAKKAATTESPAAEEPPKAEPQKKDCASGDAVEDIQCDVDKMEM